MEANTVFVDFSKIHLTKSEWKLLCDITTNPKRKFALSAEAERLCELGLAEMYETVGKENKSQSLFGTSLGSEYVEYYRHFSRQKWINAVKWLLPLLLSVAALALAIRANVSGGTRVRANNTTSTYSTVQQQGTSTQRSTTSNSNTAAVPAGQTNPSTNTTNTTGNAGAGASAEPGGTGTNAAPGNAANGQTNNNAASGEASGNPTNG